jgi:hypothetical protein
MTCKDCGQRFATADALRKHKNSGREEREPNGKQHCREIDWTSEAK